MLKIKDIFLIFIGFFMLVSALTIPMLGILSFVLWENMFDFGNIITRLI